LRPYSPGGVLNALASAPQGSIPAHLVPSFTAWTTRVSNPVCSPRFRVSASVPSREPPSPPVFLPISTNFTSTPGIPLSSPDSSSPVSNALPGLSPGLSHQTYQAAYTRFTPSNSEQRLHPLYYRGCWHRVSRCLLRRYRQARIFTPGVSSLPTELYNPKAFITHAASLRQAFAHCARFPTAASRRSLDRVSVPVWLIILSDQLPVVALVGHYPTN
jgi:hypothetical protein